MMKSLLSISLLLTLLSSVTSLICSSCHSRQTTCERNTQVSCRPNETCTSSALQSNIDQNRKMGTFRGCVLSHQCHTGDFSFSSANGKFLQMKVFCCHTEQCNNEPVHVPPRKDLSPNGRQCPACYYITYENSGTACQSQGMVNCRGNETKCIDFSGYLQYVLDQRKLEFKGCATEDFCALNGKVVSYHHIPLTRIKAKCYNAEESSM